MGYGLVPLLGSRIAIKSTSAAVVTVDIDCHAVVLVELVIPVVWKLIYVHIVDELARYIHPVAVPVPTYPDAKVKVVRLVLGSVSADEIQPGEGGRPDHVEPLIDEAVVQVDHPDLLIADFNYGIDPVPYMGRYATSSSQAQHRGQDLKQS